MSVTHALSCASASNCRARVLSITTDGLPPEIPAALLPGLIEKRDLARILPGSPVQWLLQPGMETAGLDAQTATHRPHRELAAMPGHKRVSHFASLAKYAVAFFGCRAPRRPAPAPPSGGGSSRPGQRQPEPVTSKTSASRPTTRAGSPRAAWAPLQPVAPLGDLRDRVTLEIVREMSGPHHGLLASKLGKKASKNLGAIQTEGPRQRNF